MENFITSEVDTLEIDTVETCQNESHHHVKMGYEACNLCACGAYVAEHEGGHCQSLVDANPGGICGHRWEDHQD
jgi:hypothetical protein